MTKHKILIQIFPLVTDIDLLERSLLLLKQNSLHIDKDKFHIILDVTLPLTDYLVDWDNSILKHDFFIDKFNNLKRYGNWVDECYFNIDYNLLGCVDCCINNIHKYNVDDVIWLDADIIFNQYTLNLLLQSSLEIKKQFNHYVITPEIVRLGDSTWDSLVNNNFIDKPYGYQEQNDSIIDSFNIYGEVMLEPINMFKFGGGWFTLFSKPLLDYIKFPKDIKGYCPIDTFIMGVCPYIPNSIQFKIKNLVVCEDRLYLSNNIYKNYVKTYNRRYDTQLDSWNKLTQHGNNLIKKLK